MIVLSTEANSVAIKDRYFSYNETLSVDEICFMKNFNQTNMARIEFLCITNCMLCIKCKCMYIIFIVPFLYRLSKHLYSKKFRKVLYIHCFIEDGREVLFDLENKTREEIEEIVRTTLGKTKTVARRERYERMLRTDQALFGKNCARECICAVQGQVPCTSVLEAPDYMKGKWRWNHNLL